MKTAKMLILATALASSTANAAVLQDVQGDVRVGRDKGFEQVQGSTEVLPGDRVKVGRKGSARLVYADGCNVPVEAGSLSRVAEHSPCSFKALAGDNNAPVYTPLGQQGSGIPCDPSGPYTGYNDGPWNRLAPCAILAALGGAAGAAVALEGGSYAIWDPIFIPGHSP